MRAQPPAPTLILANGKIITVDDRFTIAQAAAVRGDRIVAVGTDQEIGQPSASQASSEIRKYDASLRYVLVFAPA